MNNGNGEVFLGAAFPEPLRGAKAQLFSEKESKELRGGAVGHVLGISDYQPGTEYTYYFGAGWSKYGFANMDEWNAYMIDFAQKIGHPRSVAFGEFTAF